MPCLVDTGVLLRVFDASFADRHILRKDLRTLVSRNEQLFVALQNLAEFWNVATRPVDKNGYGLSGERTKRRLILIERFCEVITESDDSYRIWKVKQDLPELRAWARAAAAPPGARRYRNRAYW
jgi:hypothetical protein